VSHEKLSAAIAAAIGDIDEELSAARPLFDIGNVRNFDFIETAAAASILQSFYTGVENLVIYLYKSLDGPLPQSSSWHRDLLNAASAPSTKRKAIIQPDTRNKLTTYLDFRHVVRHGYAKRLKPDRTREIFLRLPETWIQVRNDLEFFSAALQAGDDREAQYGKGLDTSDK